MSNNRAKQSSTSTGFSSSSSDGDFENYWSDQDDNKLNVDKPLFNLPRFFHWDSMLNESENSKETFIRILDDMESHTKLQISLLQKKTINHLEKSLSKLITQPITQNCHLPIVGSQILEQRCSVVAENKLYLSSDINKLKRTIGVKLPIDNFENFEQFNKDLLDDQKKQLCLKQLYHHLIRDKTTVGKTVHIILSSSATKRVLQHYSGKGLLRRKSAVIKKNFSITSVYTLLEDVVMEKFKKSSKDLHVLDIVTRYLCQLAYIFQRENKDH